jgi:hypothetical protein
VVEELLTALSFYLRTLLPDAKTPKMEKLMSSTLDHVKALEGTCGDLLREM